MKKNFILNFGPQHPAAHGVLRLLINLDGEYVIKADPHIGLLHRGTEKLIEYKTFLQSLPYVDRLDYVSMMSQEHCFILTLEELVEEVVNSESSYVRVLFDEITRILNHLLSLTTHALDVGALTPFLWGFEEREKLMSLYENVSGARLHASYIRLGGLNASLSSKLLDKVFEFASQFSSRIDELEELLTNNRIWKLRLKNIGVIFKKDALTWGFTGVLLRGSNVPWDLRKTQPYALYSKLFFKISCSNFGNDCYTRYQLRISEMRQSLNIIIQCLNHINNLNNKNKIFQVKDKSLLNTGNFPTFKKYDMESVINQFKVNTKTTFELIGEEIINDQTYVAVEAPKGEFGVFLMTEQGKNMPYRCKFRAPGFFHLQGLSFMSKGHMLADVVTNIGTQDIVFGEVDR